MLPMVWFRRLNSLALLCVVFSVPVAADWRDDIGFYQLQMELGTSTPTGAGVNVSLAEAPRGSGDVYLPNTTTPNFSGKTVTVASPPVSGFSGHATSVSEVFFSNNDSIAPGVTNIVAYDANNFLSEQLGLFDGGIQVNREPTSQPYAVQNHSWISNAEAPAATNLAQRLDYVVNRDNVLAIGGTNNGPRLPSLLVHSYNAISVGLSDGEHAFGNTTFNGPGRPRPDIVAPHGIDAPDGSVIEESFTSFATPMVSSAAAMLHEYAAGNRVNATNVQAMRAVLMAGATKEEFASWDRTETRPIDEQFGAGELNVYNSFKILEGGEFDGVMASQVGTTPITPVGLLGFDHNDPLSLDQPFLYQFEVEEGEVLNDFSVFLQWNIDIADTLPSPENFNPSIDPALGGGLANLDLHLFDESDVLVDRSISAVDNFEHIYLSGLTAGLYTLEVSGDRAVEYGLAWRGVTVAAVPEPGSLAVLVISAVGLTARRRRVAVKRCL
jgi:hypothetical protein